MSAELKVQAQFTLANGSGVGSLNDNFPIPQISVDQSAKELRQLVIAATTSDTALSTTGITTLGWAFFQNLDLTNYVEIGPDNSSAILPLVRLLPGEFCVIPIKPGITVRHQAHTGTCNLFVKLYGR